MPRPWTYERLKSLSPQERAILREQANKRLNQGGREVVELIDSSGLPLSSGGMRVNDPDYLIMEEIAWSGDGKSAAIEAVERKLPALAGVEPLIVKRLGERYHKHDLGTQSAGAIVAEVMRHLGYLENGQGAMPSGSVAKTGMKWKKRS